MDIRSHPLPVRHALQFNGKAGEYFGIWIVNLLLTILTLGIYSAWAKVRHQRYFYGNTILDGHNFEYHARPINILIGRIVVVVALVLYQAMATIAPPVAGALLLVYLAFLPWLINRSLRFNARVTSYRNLRFNFFPSYWNAFLVFLIMPAVAVLTLGILAPVASKMRAQYIGNRLHYGKAPFKTDANIGDLYANWGASILVLILGSIVAGIIFFAIAMASGLMMELRSAFQDGGDRLQAAAALPLLLITLIGYASPVLAFIFYAAGVRNIAFNGTTLEGRHQLKSNLSRRRYLWILLSNLAVILFTLGLMRPWAAIRTWRYYADHTQLHSAGSLDTFVGDNVQEGFAGAAEFTAMEGIEFGL